MFATFIHITTAYLFAKYIIFFSNSKINLRVYLNAISFSLFNFSYFFILIEFNLKFKKIYNGKNKLIKDDFLFTEEIDFKLAREPTEKNLISKRSDDFVEFSLCVCGVSTISLFIYIHFRKSVRNSSRAIFRTFSQFNGRI